jgi:hypothetical protein
VMREEIDGTFAPSSSWSGGAYGSTVMTWYSMMRHIIVKVRDEVEHHRVIMFSVECDGIHMLLQACDVVLAARIFYKIDTYPH